MNTSNVDQVHTWYIINDSFIVLFNLITIVIGMTFVLLVIRTKKLRTIVNILSSNSCFCGSLLAFTIIWDTSHMLRIDIAGLSQQDQTGVIRNICTLLAIVALNYSVW